MPASRKEVEKMGTEMKMRRSRRREGKCHFIMPNENGEMERKGEGRGGGRSLKYLHTVTLGGGLLSYGWRPKSGSQLKSGCTEGH